MIIDSHEDLAWNIINLGRDYTRSAYEIREAEKDTPIPAFNGNSLLGWPQYQEGNIAIIFGTLFCAPQRLDQGTYDIRMYETPQEAHDCYRENLDTYLRLTDEHPGKFNLILNKAELDAQINLWERHLEEAIDPPPPVGIIMLMEGAEGIRNPDEVEQWYQWGVRLIGPAWAGNRFCGGTHEPGPLTKSGYALLDRMADLTMVLDISHMDYQSARQALDYYQGRVIASHSNAEALIRGIPNNRHLNDKIIKELIKRDGVMGIVPLNSFLDWHWKDHGGREGMSLEQIISQIDHVCQLAGNTRHVGLGTDFDGGYGFESVPPEIDTIADLPKLTPKLTEKGYNSKDISNIFSDNWIRILRSSLPSS